MCLTFWDFEVLLLQLLKEIISIVHHNCLICSYNSFSPVVLRAIQMYLFSNLMHFTTIFQYIYFIDGDVRTKSKNNRKMVVLSVGRNQWDKSNGA